ncbi:MAG: hypothetical protein TREMPRED_000738, partial [Tremellales sp. Tagirdzhanova-0007]
DELFIMLKPVNSIPDRPIRPLVIKCGYEASIRRVTFPSSATCRLDSLRTRVAECFSLSASPFFFTYTDDDGEDFPIRTESDLTEAILYFVSGDDDAAHSSHSGSAGPVPFSSQKVTIRVDVVVEYDGPSLSDTSSLRSYKSGDEASESSWRSSGYEPSHRSSGRNELEDQVIVEEEERTELEHVKCIDEGISTAGGSAPKPIRSVTQYVFAYFDDFKTTSASIYTTALRRIGPGTTANGTTRRYGSDEESLGSDEDSRGDFALVRDARGKYYYSYQSTETSSLSSRSEADSSPPRGDTFHQPFQNSSSSSATTTSPPGTPTLDPTSSLPLGAPILAPDCSACGIRLGYIRYVCQACGAGDMWKEDAQDKAAFVPTRIPSDTSLSDRSSDMTTEWAAQPYSAGSPTVYDLARSRSGSISTNASSGSFSSVADNASSPIGSVYRGGSGPTPPDSPRVVTADQLRPSLRNGYELCPGCIEFHGIAHAKAAAKSTDARMRRTKMNGELRHAFREKIWGSDGWKDVEYSEDGSCTICRAPLFRDRYKCYQKVDEIHPVHAFLSIPDKPLPHAGPSRSNGEAVRYGQRNESVTKPMRHPGAFCHK